MVLFARKEMFDKVYNGYNLELMAREMTKERLSSDEYTELGLEIDRKSVE